MAVFLQRLGEIRKEFGLKKKDFENAIGMKNTCRWGKTVFSVEQDTLQIIANTFDKSINWLLGSGPQIGRDQPPQEKILAEEKTPKEKLKDQVVDLVLDFVTREGGLSLYSIQHALREAETDLRCLKVTFSDT